MVILGMKSSTGEGWRGAMGRCEVHVQLVPRCWCMSVAQDRSHPSRPSAVSGAGLEVCGAWLSPLGAAGIKDTSSAFFFVFHLLGPFIASTVWGCTSWPAPLMAAPVEPLSIPLAPGAAGESNTAFLGMEMLSTAG